MTDVTGGAVADTAARLAAAVPTEAGMVAVAGPDPAGVADRLALPGRSVDRWPTPRPPAAAPAGAYDAVVYADGLVGDPDPLGTLAAARSLLAPEGALLAAFANAGHHRVVTQLLRATSPYEAGVPVPSPPHQLFTPASAVQTLLDAGYLPDTVDRVPAPPDAALAVAAGPLLERLGITDTDAARSFGTSHFVVRATPQADPPPGDETPITFVVCVNDEAQLEANLLASPCLRPPSVHEVLVFRGCASAAEGLNAGIAQARHDTVVMLHQDVYLPAGWPRRLAAQWAQAEAEGGPIALAGVFGVEDRRLPFDAIGCVVHGDRLLRHRRLPATVDGIDEVCMVVRRPTELRVEPEVGWHLYGTDLALQVHAKGGRVVVLDAPVHHNTLTGRVPTQYRQSERVVARRWAGMLPVHTNLSSIDTWLLDDEAAAPDEAADTGGAAVPADAGAVAELLHRLRAEQAAVHRELEQARLQVASMRASPFWRARQLLVGWRDRLAQRR